MINIVMFSFMVYNTYKERQPLLFSASMLFAFLLSCRFFSLVAVVFFRVIFICC